MSDPADLRSLDEALRDPMHAERADRPHGYENPTDTDTVALLVMTYA